MAERSDQPIIRFVDQRLPFAHVNRLHTLDDESEARTYSLARRLRRRKERNPAKITARNTTVITHHITED